jgi:cytochrome c oxidase subunit 2
LSTLDPAGPVAASIARLWWVMLGGAALIAALVFGCLAAAFLRRQPAKGSVRLWVLGLGLAFPTVTLTALLFYALLAGERLLAQPGQPDVLRIDATARQWTWSFSYPDGGPAVPDGGPLPIPVGRTVDVHVTSEDVIHAFWIPRLGGKIDAVPGHVNVVRLQASEPGVFGAQCAEFCGDGHAAMFFWVEALPEPAFLALTEGSR